MNRNKYIAKTKYPLTKSQHQLKPKKITRAIIIKRKNQTKWLMQMGGAQGAVGSCGLCLGGSVWRVPARGGAIGWSSVAGWGTCGSVIERVPTRYCYAIPRCAIDPLGWHGTEMVLSRTSEANSDSAGRGGRGCTEFVQCRSSYLRNAIERESD